MSFKIYSGVEDYNIGIYTCAAVLSKGTAVMRESLTGDTLVAATGEPLGFLMKDVTADGVSDFEMETLIGMEVEEVITGSYVPVVNGNGLIATDVVGTTITGGSIHSDLTITSGLWEVAGSADEVCGQLEATNVDSTTGLYLIRVLSSGVKKGA